MRRKEVLRFEPRGTRNVRLRGATAFDRQRKEMKANTATAETADVLSPANVPQCAPALQKYTDEQVRQLEAAL